LGLSLDTNNNTIHTDTETSSPQIKNRAGNDRQPTVMQVVPELVTGGVEQGTIDVASAIVEGGGLSIVVSAGGPMVKELKRSGVKHYELPVNSKNPLTMQQNIKRLINIIEEQHVDIIHARSRAPAWSSWKAARKTNKHFVTTFHGTYGHSNWFKRQYNEVMTKGDRIIAISNFIAGHILKIYGVPPNNIRVIPRGVDFNKFSPDKVSQERRIKLAREWRLPDDKPIIILPGRLTRWKGHTILIEAIKNLGRKDLQCLIVGSEQDRENYRHELERQIENYGMQELIHVVGHCDDMPAAYMLTDIVISASTAPEAFGRVMVEGQALGRLVIGTNHGGSTETVIDGQTGWLIEPNNPNSLAKTLNKVLNLTDLQRNNITRKASEHIHKYYSKEMMCAKTLDVYNELILGDASES
jgi:glycosyltransferase involved in cell wall biosynthesis